MTSITVWAGLCSARRHPLSPLLRVQLHPLAPGKSVPVDETSSQFRKKTLNKFYTRVFTLPVVAGCITR